jgi:hypothetical protein
MKPGDDRVLPLAHHLHVEQHRVGERTFWRDAMLMSNRLLRAALIAANEEIEPGSNWFPVSFDTYRDELGDEGMFEALGALARKYRRMYLDE